MTNLVVKGPAERFGRYRLLGPIGDGSLGKLHVAEQSGDDEFVEIVALRSFHPQLTENPTSRPGLAEAAHRAALLKHSNISSTHELEVAEGAVFLATEYLAGENLASVLSLCTSGEPIPPAIVAALIRQCAEGLRYAQDGLDADARPFGLVHGDVRPANIFLTYQGQAKLFAFGACGLLAQIPVVRGSARGGFAYTAPEVLEGGAPNSCSDVFSLGVVLWECLTGRQLFHADTLAKTKDAVRSRYVEPPSVIRSGIPPALDEVALRCLGRDPRRRYPSARELAEALDRVLAALPKRPTAETVADWLQRLFGSERAALKAQIAQGTAVEGALARLRLLGEPPPPELRKAKPSSDEPREPRPSFRPSAGLPPGPPSGSALRPDVGLSPSAPDRTDLRVDSAVEGEATAPAIAAPSTPGLGIEAIPAYPAPSRSPSSSLSSSSPSPSGGPPANRMVAVGVGAAVVVIGVALLIFRPGGGNSDAPEPGPATLGALQIQSTPSGAQVLIDGDPSGMVTPARIGGLRAGRKVDVQVDKPGYRSTKQTVDVPQGGSRILSFALEEASGTIVLEGLPAHASVYVDDAPVNGTQPLQVAIGTHRLRVEVGGQLFASAKLDVKAGKRVIRVQATEGTIQ